MANSVLLGGLQCIGGQLRWREACGVAEETYSLKVVSLLLALFHCLDLKLGSQPCVSGRNRWNGIYLSSRARLPWQ